MVGWMKQIENWFASLDMPKPKLTQVKCIWDQAPHNAFTDLIYYKGAFFCCFREADHHARGENGQIRIISSRDGESWHSVALIAKEGYDLRDPMLSIMPDGRLMLNSGGSVYKEGHKYLAVHSCVAFSEDGMRWSAVEIVPLHEEWLWRITWNNHIGYGVTYSFSDPTDLDKPWRAKLYQTKDGIHYNLITEWNISHNPSEATLRFKEDGTMIALVRRQGIGLIGVSHPPYIDWCWNETAYRLGGPNFLILPHEEMWAGSRLHMKKGFKKTPHTALFRMHCDSLTPLLILPSGGDNSYGGLAYVNNMLYMSYYSSHQGKAMIYFATIHLPDVGK